MYNKAVHKAFFEGYKIGAMYREQCTQHEEKTTPYMLNKSFIVPTMDKSHERAAEQEGIYLSTVLRLARMGKKTPQEQIVALAEEIEYYRSRIRALENFINQRPTKEGTQ